MGHSCSRLSQLPALLYLSILPLGDNRHHHRHVSARPSPGRSHGEDAALCSEPRGRCCVCVVMELVPRALDDWKPAWKPAWSRSSPQSSTSSSWTSPARVQTCTKDQTPVSLLLVGEALHASLCPQRCQRNEEEESEFLSELVQTETSGLLGRRGARELKVLQVPLPDPQKVPLTLGFNQTFSNTDHGRSSNETFFCIKQSLLIFFFFFSIFIGCK